MSLVKAPVPGIERLTNGQDKDQRRDATSHATHCDQRANIRAADQQVLGIQDLMSSARLERVQSLFINGRLHRREVVRTVARSVARSAQDRTRFIEHGNPCRFIQRQHKHLRGRTPRNKAEMLQHVTILQKQGYDTEIDVHLASAESNGNFGNDSVPLRHGWNDSSGHAGRPSSWLMERARGAAASAKGDGSGTQFRLGQALHRALHQAPSIPVAGAAAAVRVGPLRAAVSNDNTRPATDMSNNHRIDGTPAYGFRSSELVVSAPSAGAATEGSRVVTITATGIANNAFVRHGAYTTRVPFSRMNEALQRLIRQGGRVVSVVVSGEGADPGAGSDPKPPSPSATSAPVSGPSGEAAKPKGKAKAKARSKQA